MTDWIGACKHESLVYRVELKERNPHFMTGTTTLYCKDCKEKRVTDEILPMHVTKDAMLECFEELLDAPRKDKW